MNNLFPLSMSPFLRITNNLSLFFFFLIFKKSHKESKYKELLTKIKQKEKWKNRTRKVKMNTSSCTNKLEIQTRVDALPLISFNINRGSNIFNPITWKNTRAKELVTKRLLKKKKAYEQKKWM